MLGVPELIILAIVAALIVKLAIRRRDTEINQKRLKQYHPSQAR